MAQSKKNSLLEAAAGTLIGFVVAMITNAVVFPFFDIHTSVSTDFKITLIFTVISLIRSYLVRRAFNFWSEQ